MKKITSLFFSLIIILGILLPSFSFAATAGNVAIYPANPDPNNKLTEAWFLYNLKPGEEKEDAVKVKNTSTSNTVTVKIYAVDAETTPDGGFALKNETDKKESIGGWITLSQNELTLKPGEEKEVSFSIKIPEDAEVGEHIGGIIAENMTPRTESKDNFNVSIVTRVGVRMYQTVPGYLIKKLDITEFSHELFKTKSIKKDFLEQLKLFFKTPTLLYHVTFKNTGNVHLDPTGYIEITDIFGKTEKKDIPNLGTIFPKKETRPEINFGKAPFFGYYKAKITVNYGDNQTITKEISYWIIPWNVLILAAILFALVMTFLFIRHKIKKRFRKKLILYVVKKDDTLEDLAEKYNIKWKKLAKINKIKAPYKLVVGEEILVPGSTDKLLEKTKIETKTKTKRAKKSKEVPPSNVLDLRNKK